jgi:hypothetical protein
VTGFRGIKDVKRVKPPELALEKKMNNLRQFLVDFRVQRCVRKLFIIGILIYNCCSNFRGIKDIKRLKPPELALGKQ